MRPRLRTSLLVLLLLGALLAGTRLALPPALQYAAEESLLHGRLERALRLYAWLSRWYPRRPEAGLYELQQADIYYYKYGNLPAAAAHYRAALGRDRLPGGLATYAREQLDLIALYGGDTSFFPRFIAVADAFRRGSSAGFEEAEALGQALIADNPPPGLAGETWFLIGESRLRLEKYEEAIQAYEQVFTATTGHRLEADALYGAAYSAEQVGAYARAYEYYSRLAVAYPRTLLGEVGLFTSAQLLAQKLGRPAEARRRFELYTQSYPEGYFRTEAQENIKRLT
ncbi:MAG: hypothetical protein PWR31_1525 [Bacillota bacterium]|nr:hypothetical protein [Bacillota bacterium]MDK2927834.1 hypothetical protein [Bacillota bacterium]